MTLLAMTNARPVFKYSSASGHRASYPSYAGQWIISWPNGGPCIVRLFPHHSHNAGADVYPPSFLVRVDKCTNMLAGIVSGGERKIGFPGRAKSKGPWKLQEIPKGFGGSHGSRHLYNMQGGKVFEIDLLAMVPSVLDVQLLSLETPCLGDDTDVATVYVPPHEARILAMALNNLPWSSILWSMHRGLKDLLLAVGIPTMNRYRESLASLLKGEILLSREALVAM
ncbi:uncharacterized protein RSE6_06037 [Rhynchosporium secalis]|uniref:Uncharacterized protein n=1 Tax=Rhynchosporium secalis TaxID=38038 RepID=A0A1E1MAJ0_RHYSE|nr:uncharacterized protein RSE6_06037 [Rhynchosporium secalis]